MSQIIGYNKESQKLEAYDREMVSFLSEGYHESLYLESLPLDRLIKRIVGLTGALIEVNKYGKPVLNIGNGKNVIAFIEALEECKIRKQNVDQCITEVFKKFDNLFDLETLNQIYNQIQELHGNKCLLKFTDSQYVDDILKGRVRFCTASSYRDQGFNIAIQDDELKITSTLKNSRLKDKAGNSTSIIDDEITAHSPSDFHVSCFSSNFTYKLFALMEYDSCVVIKDAERFRDNLKRRYLKRYPKCLFWANQVEYIDICREFKSKLPIQICKSSNYIYEDEYRFVGSPKSYSVNLEPEIFIKLDSSKFEYQLLQIGK